MTSPSDDKDRTGGGSGAFSCLQVVSSVAEEASGPSYSVKRLCEALIEQGCDVTLSVLDWSPGAPLPGFAKAFALGAGPRRLGRSPAMRRWMQEEARSGRIRILHSHGLWMMPNVYPGWVAKRYRIPYVVSPRGTLGEWPFRSGSPVKRIFWPLVQRPALRAVTCWHATSEAEYSDIRRKGFCQPVAVIPIGVDVPDLPPKEPRSPRTLLYLGRIHPKKGIDLLLRAWQRVEDRHPDWRLRIVGSDSRGYLGECKRLARDLQLERVEFHGPLYGDAKWAAYREAELFVLPTRHENFGVAVAEALAAGTPVIVTQGAPWSGLEVRGAGRWIPFGLDPLVSALEDMLSVSKEGLAAMGRRGKEWVERGFSWHRIGEKMAETYRWALGKQGKPVWVIEE